MRKITITKNEAGQRLDKLLMKYLNKAPKSFLYKMLRKKNIELNGKKAEPGALLSEGDEISLWLSEETIAGFQEVRASGTGREAARAERRTEAPDPESKPAPGGCAQKDGREAVRAASGCAAQRLKEAGVAILYETEAVILANKPAGLLSQKGAQGDESINELLLSYLLLRGEVTAESLLTFKPSVCNRLDRNTSGLITFAKTYPAARMLSALFSERALHKYYLTAVAGVMEGPQSVTAYLKKDEKTNTVTVSEMPCAGADRIETAYEPIAHGEDMTLLRVLLITGKTHQIRAHLKYLGHPVLGDPKYGDAARNQSLKKQFGISHQLLHAYELQFPKGLSEPLSELSERTVQAPVPKAFQRLIDRF